MYSFSHRFRYGTLTALIDPLNARGKKKKPANIFVPKQLYDNEINIKLSGTLL